MGFALSEMQVTSEAFAEGCAIPTRYTREGENVSPSIAWSNAPAEAKSFVVFCHDPDAPLVQPRTYGYVHWVLYNIGGTTSGLEAGTGQGTSGKTNNEKPGYGGPMPPNGHGVHRYYFWVCALNQKPDLPEGLTLWEVLEKIEPHVVGMNRLVGTYERR
ncbi:MAG: YbhB/YbcL family Raf kinase inhibitor-like protein [Spirochaetales bacterium]